MFFKNKIHSYIAICPPQMIFLFAVVCTQPFQFIIKFTTNTNVKIQSIYRNRVFIKKTNHQ